MPAAGAATLPGARRSLTIWPRACAKPPRSGCPDIACARIIPTVIRTWSAVIALPVLSMAFRQAVGRLNLEGTHGVQAATDVGGHGVSSAAVEVEFPSVDTIVLRRRPVVAVEISLRWQEQKTGVRLDHCPLLAVNRQPGKSAVGIYQRKLIFGRQRYTLSVGCIKCV